MVLLYNGRISPDMFETTQHVSQVSMEQMDALAQEHQVNLPKSWSKAKKYTALKKVFCTGWRTGRTDLVSMEAKNTCDRQPDIEPTVRILPLERLMPSSFVHGQVIPNRTTLQELRNFAIAQNVILPLGLKKKDLIIDRIRAEMMMRYSDHLQMPIIDMNAIPPVPVLPPGFLLPQNPLPPQDIPLPTLPLPEGPPPGGPPEGPLPGGPPEGPPEEMPGTPTQLEEEPLPMEEEPEPSPSMLKTPPVFEEESEPEPSPSMLKTPPPVFEEESPEEESPREVERRILMSACSLAEPLTEAQKDNVVTWLETNDNLIYSLSMQEMCNVVRDRFPRYLQEIQNIVAANDDDRFRTFLDELVISAQRRRLERSPPPGRAVAFQSLASSENFMNAFIGLL